MGVTAGVMAVGSALKIGGTLYSGSQQKKEAENRANSALRQSRELAEIVQERTQQTVEQQKLAYIKSGITLGVDSPMIMLEDTRRKGEKEANRVLRGGDITASNYRTAGRNILTGSVLKSSAIGLDSFNNIFQGIYG